LMNTIIQSIQRSFHPNNSDVSTKGTLMTRIVKKKDIVYGGKDYNTGIKQFSINLGKILTKAKNKGVPVFLSDLVTNVRDSRPFGSIETSGQKSAMDVYKSAVQYEQMGDYKTAKELYYKAKDLDCVRFRAPGEINDIIREYAKKYDAIFVPMVSSFEANSPHELVGNNLLLEHVHPNIAGYFLMADVFYKQIIKSQIIGVQPDVYRTESADYYKRNWGYTELDSLLGYHRIANLSYHWPFRDESKMYLDYRQIYKPKSMVDSLAFNIMTKKIPYSGDAHISMAKYYIQNKDYYNAFREYNALLKINPYIAENYNDAAENLTRISDLPLALEYLLQSVKYKETFFADFKLGEIYTIKNDIKNAIRYFEAAYKIVPQNFTPNILTKLYMVYMYDNQNDKAKSILNKMKIYNPNLSNVPVPPQSNTFMNFIPVQIAPYVEKSKELVTDGKLDEALDLLYKAINVYDSPIPNRLIAEIYITKKDKSKSYYFMEKSFPYFNTDPEFMKEMISVYLVNRQPEKAQKVLKELKQIVPNSAAVNQIENYVNSQLR
jgi:tetratricopeptide (TPR) repeat protein